MADVLAPIREGFFDRIRASTFASSLLAQWPRAVLMLGIALLPPALFFLFVLAGPREVAFAVTDTNNVKDLFGRIMAGLITAATIAVSVSAFTLRGDLKDFARFRAEQESKEEFRDDLRELLDAPQAPLLLSELLAETLEAAAAKARAIRLDSGAARDVVVSGAGFEEYLLVLEERASLVAAKVRASHARPDRLHLAVLDMEHELVLALARRFLRDERIAGPTRERLDELHQLLRRMQILVRYAKKLDLEWGLSRMSYAMLATTTPAVIVAALVTLSYGDAVVPALGLLPTAALVCAGLAVILLPLGAFASYLVRFVFLNQHTLAHDGFVLGPEEPDVGRSAPHRGSGRTAQAP